jgi:hypothetical protein
MQLELEEGPVLENPDGEAIARAMHDAPSGYAILSKAEESYIQSAGDPSEGYVLEYQDGSSANHYRATNKPIALDHVIAAFQSYATGAEEWKSWFDWEKMDLDKKTKTGCFGAVVLVALGGGLLGTLLHWARAFLG